MTVIASALCEAIQSKSNHGMAENFFMTGGTGMVGSELVPRLLKAYPGSTVTLLARASSDAAADDRLGEMRARLAGDIPDVRERVRGVRGDVLEEECGLSREALARLLGETTYIIHGAATIRFDHPIDEARLINCGGTRRMLAIAERCTARGRLKRFVYIGTSSVSGQRAGRITEDELEMGQKFFNTYEQSKCESERIVRDSFARVPAVVFRPSIIIGDSRTGATSAFNVI